MLLLGAVQRRRGEARQGEWRGKGGGREGEGGKLRGPTDPFLQLRRLVFQMEGYEDCDRDDGHVSGETEPREKGWRTGFSQRALAKINPVQIWRLISCRLTSLCHAMIPGVGVDVVEQQRPEQGPLGEYFLGVVIASAADKLAFPVLKGGEGKLTGALIPVLRR